VGAHYSWFNEKLCQNYSVEYRKAELQNVLLSVTVISSTDDDSTFVKDIAPRGIQGYEYIVTQDDKETIKRPLLNPQVLIPQAASLCMSGSVQVHITLESSVACWLGRETVRLGESWRWSPASHRTLG
jgi:hypothetical protein